MKWGWFVSGWVVVGLLLAGAPAAAEDAERAESAGARPLRVLLVGNSYTRFNIMPVLLSRVAASVADGPAVRVHSVARAGYTLRMHWRRAEHRAQIRSGRYTHVVLQGHSMSALRRPDEMRAYAQRFGDLIAQAGARPVLYETWARAARDRVYRRSDISDPSAMLRVIADAYEGLGGALDAPVAPVGHAFALALSDAPELPLLRRDGSHPTVQGSYLAALLLYATLTGVDPQRVTYKPWPIAAEQAEQLRTVAARAHAAVRGGGDDAAAETVLAAHGGPTSIDARRARMGVESDPAGGVDALSRLY